MSDIEPDSPILGVTAQLQKFLYEQFYRIKIRLLILAAGEGVTDTFTTVDGKTVTVTNGVITNIV